MSFIIRQQETQPAPQPVEPSYDPRFYQPDGTPRPLQDVQQLYMLAIKSRAMSEIFAKYPAWKQDNINSRGIELTYQMAEKPLTPEEHAEVAAFKAVWTEIKLIRLHSDALEEEMLSLSWQQLQHWEQHGWPSQRVTPEAKPA